MLRAIGFHLLFDFDLISLCVMLRVPFDFSIKFFTYATAISNELKNVQRYQILKYILSHEKTAYVIMPSYTHINGVHLH